MAYAQPLGREESPTTSFFRVGEITAEDPFDIQELPHDTGHSSFESSFNVMIGCHP